MFKEMYVILLLKCLTQLIIMYTMEKNHLCQEVEDGYIFVVFLTI